jgi:uncharacterized protein
MGAKPTGTNTTSEFSFLASEVASKGDLRVDRPITASWIGPHIERCEYPVRPKENASGNAHFVISRTDSGFFLKGEVTAQLESKCGTCLAELVIEPRAQLSCFLAPRPSRDVPEDDTELTMEDLETEWYEGDEIVLDELIADAIVLELPMNPKCANRCAGLAAFEQDSPGEIDPRLAPLASIRLEKEN